MFKREVTLREFANYARAVGGYCSYHDALAAVNAVLGVLPHVMSSQNAGAARALLPSALRPSWDSFSVNAGEDVWTLAARAGEFSSREEIGRAMHAVFSSLKEKLREGAPRWQRLLPAELLLVWERSQTVDASQQAKDCL
ncbi:MAG: hypothetical protein M0031_14930 [Thermaerobacter sp.]|nr:hypothetical protein [Thermaerobacter sp.]